MLGIDGETKQRWREEQSKESLREARQQALAQELQSNTVTVEPDSGRDVSDLLAQLGKVMTAEQVIGKLKKCNNRLIFIRAKGYDLYGIYLLDPNGKLHINEQGEAMFITHICGMEAGIMPEFSVLHKTKTRLPNQELFGKDTPTREIGWKEVETFSSETRGWRTVLVRLLHAGLITRYQVEKHFGWSPSLDSKKWHDRTQ